MSDYTNHPLWVRIRRLLPRADDTTLVLLKGHLLVEEQLFAYIAAHCQYPKSLPQARLTFAQKLRLAQTLSGGFNELVHPLEKLNSIRNQMAHSLEVLDLDTQLEGYLKAWEGDEFVPPQSKQERIRQLRYALIAQISMIAGMSEGIQAVRQKIQYARSG